MREIPFQDLKESDKALQPEIEEAVLNVLRSGRYLFGENVKSLERELCETSGARYCVAVSNGLDALRLILEGYISLGKLKKGDRVIVPGNTFIATFLSVIHSGLVPIVAEPSEKDFNLDLEHLDALSGVKAIIVVHLFGTPCWNGAVLNKARKEGLLVIEDNAQAIGAEASEEGFHGSKKTGNLGDAAAISFYPAKNIGACGDAGAVLTSDRELAQTVRKLSNYGSEKKYHHELAGFNCRMDEIQAAILRIKLRHLDEISRKRRETALEYDRKIDNPLVVKPKIFEDRKQVWHQYVVRTGQRDRLRRYLDENGIKTEIHYPVPSHLQPGLKEILTEGDTPLSYPVTEKLVEEILSLPVSNITREEAGYIASIINNFS